MRFNQGFALPIVLLISVVATSLLAYDLHRLQAHGQLSRIELVKSQAQVLMEVEAHQFIDQLNAQFSRYQCHSQDLLIHDHPCGFEIQPLSKRILSQDQDFMLEAMVTPNEVTDLNSFGILTLTTTINMNGQNLSWHRYSYLTIVDTVTGELALARSQLVHYL